MALNPHSEQPDLSSPEEYHADHPDEHPTDWGWHGEWGRAGRVAGYIVATILLLMITSTHYNFSGAAWLIGIAAVIVGILGLDARRRRKTWRERGGADVPIGAGAFLIVVGLILEFVPRDNSRTLALNVVAVAIMVVGSAELVPSLVERIRRRHAQARIGLRSPVAESLKRAKPSMRWGRHARHG